MFNDADNEQQITEDARKTMHVGNGVGLFNPDVKFLRAYLK